MNCSDKDKRELALFWAFVWPAIGATLGMVWGVAIGVAIGGLLTAIACGVVGAVLGFETGHFAGMFLTLFFLPWIKLLEYGDWWSVFGGVLVSGFALVFLVPPKTGPGIMTLIGAGGFLVGAWLYTAVGGFVAWIVRRCYKPRQHGDRSCD
jgi:hypothetical protein